MRYAKDIMSRDVIKVHKDTPVMEIVKLLLRKRITGVPVVDDQDRVCGIASESDLIFKEGSILPVKSYYKDAKRFKIARHKVTGQTAKEIMTRDIITAKEDTSIEDLATLMFEKDVRRIPIIRNGKMVGIVTRTDIARTILKNEGEDIPKARLDAL